MSSAAVEKLLPVKIRLPAASEKICLAATRFLSIGSPSVCVFSAFKHIKEQSVMVEIIAKVAEAT
ncbi:hypothetical protein TYRP_015022 [Tyrophagus putrescentiae]|nr:hypothetical protein TYRP_015022 [Tyrophagus putrescentiae]